MFTTFVGVSSPKGEADQPHPTQPNQPSPTKRPKRNQVSRACDLCRTYRIKCDNNSPCQNCRDRNAACKRGGRIGRSTALLHDSRINELEKELLTEKQNNSSTTSRPLRSTGHRCDGIQTRTGKSTQAQWYGPSSSFYFISRMSAFLGLLLGQPQSDDHWQPNSDERDVLNPTIFKDPSIRDFPGIASREFSVPGPEYLSGTEEDYFLGLFWQSYHSIYQIVDESEFREHYRSLWLDSEGRGSRNPSALVDMILALCMQYGCALPPPGGSKSKAMITDDASIAGRQYYHRAQTLLAAELEAPSISTLQCHLFSVIYLCNASFQNMAHTTLALALRTAHILGLHLDPPNHISRTQQELRRRIWWTLYAIETKFAMKLGRPMYTEPQITCQLPADDHQLALLSASNFASYGDNVTCLTYGRLSAKLLLVTQDIYLNFQSKCADLLVESGHANIYQDLIVLETSARFLASEIKSKLLPWTKLVPEGLRTNHLNQGATFTTDDCTLNIERFAPLWLQRQRVILELLFHNLSMNMYRTFICFPSIPIMSAFPTTREYCSMTAEILAMSCVKHAIKMTKILRQVLLTTEILSGWYEAFQWAWNATLSMVGFMLAYPLHPDTSTARSTIDHAVTVFESFGNFAVAASAANVTRKLIVKVDTLISCFGAGSVTMRQELNSPLAVLEDNVNNQSSASFHGVLADAMGLTTSEDSFYSFEPLYADSLDLGNSWNFNQ